jgi:hypothetical protein
MPGGLWLTTALFFYALSILDVVRLLGAVALHFIIGWIYLVLAVLALPRHRAAADTRPNPFSTAPKPGQ